MDGGVGSSDIETVYTNANERAVCVSNYVAFGYGNSRGMAEMRSRSWLGMDTGCFSEQMVRSLDLKLTKGH